MRLAARNPGGGMDATLRWCELKRGRKIEGLCTLLNHEERYRISGKPNKEGLKRCATFLPWKERSREQTNTVNGGLEGDDPLQNVLGGTWHNVAPCCSRCFFYDIHVGE